MWWMFTTCECMFMLEYAQIHVRKVVQVLLIVRWKRGFFSSMQLNRVPLSWRTMNYWRIKESWSSFSWCKQTNVSTSLCLHQSQDGHRVKAGNYSQPKTGVLKPLDKWLKRLRAYLTPSTRLRLRIRNVHIALLRNILDPYYEYWEALCYLLRIEFVFFSLMLHMPAVHICIFCWRKVGFDSFVDVVDLPSSVNGMVHHVLMLCCIFHFYL